MSVTPCKRNAPQCDSLYIFHIDKYTHTYVQVSVCIYIYIYIYIHVYIHIHSTQLSSNSTYLGMLAIQVQHGATACIQSICTHICMYFTFHLYKYTHTYVHKYVYIFSYICMKTHVHIHIHSARLSSNSTYLGVVAIRAQHCATTRLHSTYTNTHIHIHTYAYVCIYIHTHTAPDCRRIQHTWV